MAEQNTITAGNKQAARKIKMPRRPRSDVWGSFNRFTDGDGTDKAECKRCRLVLGADTRSGTSTLRNHVKICLGQDGVSVAQSRPTSSSLPLTMQLQLSSAPGESSGCHCQPHQVVQLEEEAAREDLARMIALHGYDPSVVEDDHFRSFVRRLNPEFEVPSRVSIENMCDGIFDEARRDLLDRLRRAPGSVSVALGRAKTMEEKVYYVACHFIDDGWNLHKLLLHAIVTTDHHDGHNGAILGLHHVSTYGMVNDLLDVTSEHGIYDSLFMLAYEMTDEDIHLTLKDTYSYRRSLLSTNPKRKQVLFTTYVDNVLHSIARCLLLNNYFNTDVDCDIKNLHLTRQGRLEHLADLELHHGWAYDEHWYTCYCSLEVLCKEGFPVKHIEDRDIVVAKLLCKLWEKIYRAIQKISSSTRPTANLCLAELFKLREVLPHELARFSSEGHGDYCYVFVDNKDVTCVLREACDTLDKAIQDSYMSWSIPLALDPRYKLKFITFSYERAYGSEAAKEYISKVTTVIRELYADYAKEYGTRTDGADHSDGASVMDTSTSGDNPLEKAWNEHCRSQQGMTTEVTKSSYPEPETELDRYLRDPLAPSQVEDFDILSWWKAHSSEYPMVARMARDALAMPTCSKLSSDQMAQVRSILRGYSEEPYRD